MTVGVDSRLLQAVAEADVCLTIPMAGFVESFNVSVAAALVMWQAREDRIRRLGRHSDLTPEQAEVLTAVYCLKSHSRTASWVDEVVSRAVLHGKWKGPADAAPGVRQEQSAAA